MLTNETGTVNNANTNEQAEEEVKKIEESNGVTSSPSGKSSTKPKGSSSNGRSTPLEMIQAKISELECNENILEEEESLMSMIVSC